MLVWEKGLRRLIVNVGFHLECHSPRSVMDCPVL